MGCSHAVGCPLFPLLRASLQGWRDYYCDSADQWHDCARYQLSLTGERVPISLLPNGAIARHLEGTSGANRSSATNPTQAPRQAPQPQPDAWSRPVPAGPPEPASPGPEQLESTAWFGAAPPPAPHPAPVPSHQPSPHTPTPHSSHRPARHTAQAPGAKRGLLGRIADWMRGPA
ncbi:hypothetical protein TNCT6_27950 [Streptomyces sp. 6-11-2]|nr:hypothetical protein TNCT6_27950 [Streptomyces sp. 6-11-2]